MEVRPTEEVSMRLEWAVTCRLACYAMLANISFDEMVERALRVGLERHKAGA